MRNVLLIVDDFPTYSYLSDLLQYFGLRVEWARSWISAVQLYEHSHYDLLMLDEWMINKDIGNPMTWLTKDEGQSVILMCEPENLDAWDRCLGTGEAILLPKPITARELKSTIEYALSDIRLVSGS